MHLSDFILDHIEAILQEWEDFAKTIEPPAFMMNSKELRDHAAQMLEAIALDLRTPQTDQEQFLKSRGLALRNPGEDTAAETHADDRAESGYTINQLVAEYRALRASVLTLWRKSPHPELDSDLNDVTRFNEGIDQALAESVARYAENADRREATERARLNALLEAAPVGIAMNDITGRLILANTENRRIWGEHPSPGKLADFAVWKGWWVDGSNRHGKPLQPCDWPVARALAGEAAPSDILEIEPFDQPGIRRTILLHAAPIRDASNRIAGAVVAQMDITDRLRVEAALRNSEERYRTLFETMDQGFCIIEMMFDATGNPVDYQFLEMNERFEQHAGLAGTIGKTARELMPTLEEFWFQTYGRVAQTGESVRFEHEAVVLNRWFDVHATRVGGPDSKKVALLFRDISARKRTDEELRNHVARQAFQLQLADRLRPLSVPDDVTAAASELLGQYLKISRVSYCEVDDVQGTFVVRQDWTSEGISTMASGIRRLDDFGPEIIAHLRSGQIMAVDDVTVEPRTAPYVDAYKKIGVRANAAIPLFKGGRFSAVLALHCETPYQWTEQKLALAQDTVERTWAAVDSAVAQHALRIERDRSQAVFDSMTEGFALLDQDWTILEVNENGARVAQHERASLIGQNHWQAFPELVGTELESLYSRVQQTRQAETVEYPHTYPSGDRCWLEVRVYPMDEGKLSFFFRDISDRKKAEEELREAGRRKDDFLAMLAHELRNPLAPIGAAAGLLQLGRIDQAQVQKTSEIIGRQVHHMTHLIDDLLDVSRVTRGLVKLERAPLEIRHAVTEAVEQVNPLIHSRGHQLALHLLPDATMVLGDKKRLVQVIANILNNAAKYTHEGGQLELKTTIQNAHVVIEVTDNGIGMAQELVTQAFDLFAQAERTSDRSSGGLGLGLALVKSLVELHDGTVTCTSDGLGKGTRFTVRLPLVAVSKNDALRQPDEYDQNALTKPLRIMVVDDNADAAAMLAMLLEVAGHEVLIEHGSYRALERGKLEAPQVFLLDIGLPDIDGYQLAQRLRAQRETADAILIAVTGYGQESDRIRTARAGFAHHLVKPVDISKLAAILVQISETLSVSG